MSLASLCSWIVFFSESDSIPRTLLFISSQEPVRKNSGAEDLSTRMRVSSRRPRSRIPLSIQREVSPVSFSHLDKRPSAIASNMVSFEESDEEPLDDSMYLAASDASDWMGSSHNPTPLPSLEPINARASIYTKFIRVLSYSYSCLDEWLVPRCLQAPPQQSAPFFPEVHHELTKS